MEIQSFLPISFLTALFVLKFGAVIPCKNCAQYLEICFSADGILKCTKLCQKCVLAKDEDNKEASAVENGPNSTISTKKMFNCSAENLLLKNIREITNYTATLAEYIKLNDIRSFRVNESLRNQSLPRKERCSRKLLKNTLKSTLKLLKNKLSSHSLHGQKISDMKCALNNIKVRESRFQNATIMQNNGTDLFKSKELTCNFTYCPLPCHCNVNNINNLVLVNCSGKGISTFPNISQIVHPVILHLQNNTISELPKQGEIDWKMVRELHLENNKLRSMDNLEQFLVLSPQNNNSEHFYTNDTASDFQPPSIFLSGNPWECECGTEIVKRLNISGNVADYDEIMCTAMGELMHVKNATRENMCCPEFHFDKIHIGIGLFLIVFVLKDIIAILVYRYRTVARLWLFTHGLCLSLVADEDTDADKEYDAFISYSTLDEEWVAKHLVKDLENGSPSYRLCVHGRDWPAGEFLSKLIYKSIKQSRRTIVVLTDNYVKSAWCRFEFQAAYQHAISDGVNRVLAVVPENVPSGELLTDEIEAFITLRTYIKWEDRHFWRKLRGSMPRVKATQNNEELMKITCSESKTNTDT